MAITASEARKALFPLIKQVNEGHEAVGIVSKHGNAVLVSPASPQPPAAAGRGRRLSGMGGGVQDGTVSPPSRPCSPVVRARSSRRSARRPPTPGRREAALTAVVACPTRQAATTTKR